MRGQISARVLLLLNQDPPGLTRDTKPLKHNHDKLTYSKTGLLIEQNRP